MVDKKLCSKGSCNSHDTTQMARWRSMQDEREKPHFGHMQTFGRIAENMLLHGECRECGGIGCRKCRGFGFTYKRWMRDIECDALDKPTLGINPSLP